MTVLAVHAVVKFPRISGLSRDVVENTFSFGSDDGVTPVNLAHLTTALENFYNSTSGGQTRVLSAYINNTVVRTPHPVVEYYDITGHLNGTPAGAPIGTGDLPISNAAAAAELPDEVAVCLSFRGAYGGDVEHGALGSRPRARDRGRIFLGPLISHADVVDTTTGQARVSSVLRADMRLAALALLAEMNTENEGWAVWSRKNAVMINVVDGWIDDAFDTQRRRGLDPTAKTTW